MSINIIVADDSATIQKVVSITLANESAKLKSCENHEELISLISEKKYQAVLLDFGLSEEKSGYELISEIKSIDKNIKILTMLPAFESVDESRLSEVGSFDTITKPFESAKFLASFREMIAAIDYDEVSDELIENIEGDNSLDTLGEVESSEEEGTDDFNPDNWISRSPSIVDEGSTEESDELSSDFLEGDNELSIDNSQSDVNELSASISDWGIEIPTPIESQNSSTPSFPPVIDGQDNNFENDEDLDILHSKEAVNNTLDLGESDFDPFVQEDDEDVWKMSSNAEVDNSVNSVDDESTREIILEEDFSSSLGNDSTPSIDEQLESSGNFEEAIEDEATREIQFDSEALEEDREEPRQKIDAEDDEIILPADDDLEYPDLGADLSMPEESSNDLSDIQFDNPSDVPADRRRPHFVDFENLQLDGESPINNIGDNKVRETRELEKEIEEDIDPDNFWDEDAGLASSNAGASSQAGLASSNAGASSNTIETQQSNLNNIDVEKFFNEIKVELLERVDRVVREICEEKIEKVAWEVLPEIAENLIKKEIKSIEQNEESR